MIDINDDGCTVGVEDEDETEKSLRRRRDTRSASDHTHTASRPLLGSLNIECGSLKLEVGRFHRVALEANIPSEI